MLNRQLLVRQLWRAAALGLALLAPLLALAQKGSTPLIYEVTSATNTVYLLGTVHVGTRQMYPLGSAVEQAFARSGVLALEADPNDRAGLVSSMQRSMYQAPDNLRNHISAALLAELEAILPRVGLPMEYAQAMQPHLLAMTVSMMEIARLGYDPGMGVDLHLANQAKARGMPLVQLESMDEQMRLFEGLSEETKTGMLQYSIRAIATNELEGDVEAMLAAWSAGDAHKLQEVIERETAAMPPATGDELRELMYAKRNRAMADKIEAILSGTVPHFIAIGAGHLLERDGLVELLRARGFGVRQL